MRYSSFAGALLLAPVAFASPIAAPQGLDARDARPTCNPNNVRSVKQQKPVYMSFCSNWAKATVHAAPVTVTGLNNAQISNICKCLSAGDYVSGVPLTSIQPSTTSTHAASSTTKAVTTTIKAATTTTKATTTTTKAATTTTTTKATTTTTTTLKVGTTTSASTTTTSAAASCSAGVKTASDGAIFRTLCDQSFDGAIGQQYAAGSVAACQTKCTGTCKGFVYNAASRSCVLFTEIDDSYPADGSVAVQYQGGRASSSSSVVSSSTSSSKSSSSTTSSTTSAVSSSTTTSVVSSSSSSSTTSAASSSTTSSIVPSSSSSLSSSSSSSSTSSAGTSTAAPSVMNLYVASSPSATTGGSIVRMNLAGGTTALGSFPTPTPLAKRDVVTTRDTTCAGGNTYYSNGVQYTKFCGSLGSTFSTSPNRLTDQPSSYDNITSLNDCIDFCTKVTACRAVAFVATPNTCTLYGATTASNVGEATASGSGVAYSVDDYMVASFILDPSSGYVYVNESALTTPTGNALVADNSGKVILANIDAGVNTPLSCALDGSLRLTCSYTYSNIKYAKVAINTDSSLSVKPGSIGSVSFYAAALNTTAPYVPTKNTVGAVKTLIAASDFNNSASVGTPKYDKTTAATASYATFSFASSVYNLVFQLAAQTTSQASVALTKSVFVYTGDSYRFTASLALPNGPLPSDVTCVAGLSIDDTTHPIATVSLGTSYGSSFDFLYESAAFPQTRTSAVTFTVTCTNDDESSLFNYPVTVSKVSLVANPAVPVDTSAYTTTGTSTSYAAYEKFYNGTGTLLSDLAGVASSKSSFYVGNQAAAAAKCAAVAASNEASTFEVYYTSIWNCVYFTDATTDFPSASFFTETTVGATQVAGYYMTPLIPEITSS